MPFLFLLAMLTMAPFVHAAEPILSSYYVDSTDAAVLRRLGERFDLERRNGTGYEVIVARDRASELLAVVPSARLLESDIQDVFRRLDRETPRWRFGYHTFSTVQSELNQIVADHGSLASLEPYGKSQDGRPLFALRLNGWGGGPGVKPEILVTSSTHGDELTTVEVTMGLIAKLVAGYGSDERITKMLDNHIVYFIPVVCPDGYVNHSRTTNGIDPNRNFPYPDEPDRTPNASIANEIAWFQKHNIVGSLDIHSNLATVMYPWAYTSQGPAAEDLDRFKELMNMMAQATGYNFGQIADVFGIARGSSADYWYWKKRTMAFGYEISGSVVPSSSELPNIVEHNREAIWKFIEAF